MVTFPLVVFLKHESLNLAHLQGESCGSSNCIPRKRLRPLWYSSGILIRTRFALTWKVQQGPLMDEKGRLKNNASSLNFVLEKEILCCKIIEEEIQGCTRIRQQ